MSISTDDLLLVTGDYYGEIKIYSNFINSYSYKPPSLIKKFQAFSKNHPKDRDPSIRTVLVRADKVLASVTGQSVVKQWDFRRTKEGSISHKHDFPVYCLCSSPSNPKLYFSGSSDSDRKTSKIMLWNVDKSQPLYVKENANQNIIYDLRFLDNSRLAVRTRKEVNIWDFKSGSYLYRTDVISHPKILDIAHSEQLNLLFCCTGENIVFHDVRVKEKGAELGKIDHPASRTFSCICCVDKQVIAGDDSGTINVFDVRKYGTDMKSANVKFLKGDEMHQNSRVLKLRRFGKEGFVSSSTRATLVSNIRFGKQTSFPYLTAFCFNEFVTAKDEGSQKSTVRISLPEYPGGEKGDGKKKPMSETLYREGWEFVEDETKDQKIEELEKKLKVMGEKMKSTSKRLFKNEDEFESLKEDVSVLSLKNKDLTQQNKELQTRIIEYTGIFAEKNAELEKSGKKMEEEAGKLEKFLQEKNVVIVEQEKKIKFLEGTIIELKKGDDEDKLKRDRELAQLKIENDRLKAEGNSQVSDRERYIDSLKSEIADLKFQMNKVYVDSSEKESRLEEVIKKLRKEREENEEKISTEKSKMMQSQVMEIENEKKISDEMKKEVMELKETVSIRRSSENRLKNEIKRLGNLLKQSRNECSSGIKREKKARDRMTKKQVEAAEKLSEQNKLENHLRGIIQQLKMENVDAHKKLEITQKGLIETSKILSKEQAKNRKINEIVEIKDKKIVEMSQKSQSQKKEDHQRFVELELFAKKKNSKLRETLRETKKKNSKLRETLRDINKTKNQEFEKELQKKTEELINDCTEQVKRIQKDCDDSVAKLRQEKEDVMKVVRDLITKVKK